MSVIAISESMGSLGIEIGRTVAASLGHEFAERDIITKAADRFGEDVARVSHAAEERPTLLERFTAAQGRFASYVHATVQEMAARDNIVLVGLASTIILADAPHTLRVRVTGSESRRAERLAQEQALAPAAALHQVHESDRERAGRVRFLYHVDWEDPLLYDLVINTDRTDVAEAAQLVRRVVLEHERFQSTAASRRAMQDLSLAAQARAVLLADPVTRGRPIAVECTDGVVALRGRVEEWAVRRAAEHALARVGIQEVHFLTPAAIDGEGADDDRHGESRRWGGYGRGR